VTGQTDLGNQREDELVTVASARTTVRTRPSLHTGFLSLAVAGGVLIAIVTSVGGGGGDRPEAQVGVVSASSEPAPSERTSSEQAPSEPAPSQPAPSEATGSKPTPQPVVPSVIPPDLAAAFGEQGTLFTPLAPGVAPPDAGALQSAIDLARAQFGPAGTAIAIPATVTVEGYHKGDEDSPLVIEDRAVIAVQITGLSMPPFGGRPGDPPVPRSEYSTELVVFVDAITGEYLLARSVR
jgi:hypothetical protein